MAKMMIESNAITEFRQIFEYLPKTTLAREIGKNNTRMTELKENVGKLQFADIYQISQLIGVDHFDIIRLISTQYINSIKEHEKR